VFSRHGGEDLHDQLGVDAGKLCRHELSRPFLVLAHRELHGLARFDVDPRGLLEGREQRLDEARAGCRREGDVAAGPKLPTRDHGACHKAVVSALDEPLDCERFEVRAHEPEEVARLDLRAFLCGTGHQSAEHVGEGAAGAGSGQ
jgi:hypothetical protein